MPAIGNAADILSQPSALTEITKCDVRFSEVQPTSDGTKKRRYRYVIIPTVKNKKSVGLATDIAVFGKRRQTKSGSWQRWWREQCPVRRKQA